MEQDPEYVIRRFESGRYAVNAEVRELYLQAIDLAEVRVHRNVDVIVNILKTSFHCIV